MAVFLNTGFDSLVTSGAGLIAELLQKGFIFSSTSDNPVTVTGRNGVGLALRVRGNTGQTQTMSYYSNPASPLANGAMGLACRAGGIFSGSHCILGMIDSNGIQLELEYAGENLLVLNYNPSGTTNDIATTFAIPIANTISQFFEIRWNSTTIQVAVNNQVVYTKTQTAQVGFRSFYTSASDSTSRLLEVDDFYLADDSTFRGDSYSRPLALTSTVSDTGTVTGAADAHTALASFDGDTSYVAYSADGQKTLLEIADISDNPATIHAVSLVRSARKNDTGSVTESLLLKSASENTVGGTFSGFALTYSGRRVCVPLDPHDSSAWTKAKVNSLQPGIKRGA